MRLQLSSSLLLLISLPYSSAFWSSTQKSEDSKPEKNDAPVVSSTAEYTINVDGTASEETVSDQQPENVGAQVTTEDDHNSSCGLYLAESSIPHSGLGMFTAKPIGHNERIFYGEIVCNIEDFEEKHEIEKTVPFTIESSRTPSWLLDSYYWAPTNALAEFEAEEVSSVIPGLGMLANSHPGLVNSLQRPPKRVADFHRAQDPGAGASTHFHDVHFIADGEIEAGAELLWSMEILGSKTVVKTIGNIPLSRHWKHSDALLKKYSEIFDGKLESETARDTYELLQFAVKLEPRMKNALPSDVSDLPTALEHGAAKTLLPGRVKTKEWLQENGVCLDNIRPDMSTLREAGRSVIAPLPVVQLRRFQMEVYEARTVVKEANPGVEGEEDEEADEVFRIGTQLLLNYCFGHPKSSLLLYPYSPAVNYVNHNQTMKNAELRWSNHTSHRKNWLDISPADLAVEKYAGLIMELVATRDIEAGEEIFLDYGDEWEEAWQKYLLQWKPSEETYVSAADRNAQNEPLLLDNEMVKDPAYENVLLGCFVELPKDDSDEDDTPIPVTWEPATEEVFDVDDLYECFVVQKHNDGKYDVIINEERQTWRVKNIPRDAIQYFDTMYSSDMFIRSAFRHEMALPDNMVPEVWRDIVAER